METKQKPRVLVTTVGAWSSLNGSDTMSSLIMEYGAENVAALYIRAEKSDSPAASRYFHIIEGRVLQSILYRNIVTGEMFTPENVQVANIDDDQAAEQSRYSYFKKHRSYIYVFAREFVWILGKWKSQELKSFLDDFRPDVLVCPIESYIHFNTINEYIIDYCHPKVLGFLWDDNFTYKQAPGNIGHQIHRFWLRKSVRRMVSKCYKVFSLSPKMKEECDVTFGINSQVLTKPIFNQGVFIPYTPSCPIRILYTGKLIIGRDKTIMEIVSAIQEINREGTRAYLDIYTDTGLDDKTLARIQVAGCCTLHDPIPQSEVFKRQAEADVLLFAESLSDRNLTARLSFSTKLTDYFSAGKCIWAVGHTDLGPIDYLRREDAGLLSVSIQEIFSTLQRMVEDRSLISDYAQKAYRCGVKNHSKEKILKTFYDAIIEPVEEIR